MPSLEGSERSDLQAGSRMLASLHAAQEPVSAQTREKQKK